MKILKYKKIKGDKYEIILDNNEKIYLYEDIIVSNNLLLNKEINDELLKSLEKQNNDFYIYSIALNYISIRMRSIKEIKEYLAKKNVSSLLIDKVVDKLIKNGYLNDEKFAKAYYHDQLTLTQYGPYRIKKNLLNLGVKEDIIDKIIKDFDHSIIDEKLSKLINKQLKLKKGSYNMIKIKLLNYFCNLGYNKNDILNILSKIDIKTDNDYLKKEYYKLYNKYQKKYNRKELDILITNKLLSKGYCNEEINNIKMED